MTVKEQPIAPIPSLRDVFGMESFRGSVVGASRFGDVFNIILESWNTRVVYCLTEWSSLGVIGPDSPRGLPFEVTICWKWDCVEEL